MFGLHFLYVAALWALPLAALPILLHLLFRRKSPLVPFSTLRFVRASLQRTAARRRVHRWLLLAVRALLLALLIWAVAQPAKILASGWAAGGRYLNAALVVDTSYSMLLQEQDVTLLDRAGGLVEDLLRGPLRDAQVALYLSRPADADHPERLQSAGAIQSQWSGLSPQASPVPLADRAASAGELLQRQSANQKWLVVISDLQSREFARPLRTPEDVRLILFDLHPREPRSAGVTGLSLQPHQPIPGTRSIALAQVTGRASDARAVGINVGLPDGKSLASRGPLMANLDAGGRAQVSFALDIPAAPFVLIEAKLQSADAMPWDDSRRLLVESAARQRVTLLEAATPTPAQRFLRLALDPSEGKLPAWPLQVREGAPEGREDVLVCPLTRWPSEAQAQGWIEQARRGARIILLLQPGLESTWASLGEGQRKALLRLLPSPPGERAIDGDWRVVAPPARDPLLGDLSDDAAQWNSLRFSRLAPLAAGEESAVLLNAASSSGTGGRQGVLFRKSLGQGVVFTLVALPEPRHTNLATHPLFLPLLVKMCLRPMDQTHAQNAELGQPLVLPAAADSPETMELTTPGGQTVAVPRQEDEKGRRFVFEATDVPGVYVWRKPADSTVIAMGNVQLPADESDLIYREADRIVTPGESVLVVRSMAELESKLNQINEPQPRWSLPIALVLMLLCFEAFIGNVTRRK